MQSMYLLQENTLPVYKECVIVPLDEIREAVA